MRREAWAMLVCVVGLGLCALAQGDVEEEFSEVLRPGLVLRVDKGCGAVYKLGEYLEFTIRSERDGYLTVFDFDSAGSVRIIFPNNYWPYNYVRGGEELFFPGKFAPYRFRVVPPEGKEILFAVITERPHEFVPADYVLFQGIFPQLRLSPEEAARMIVRAIEVIPEDEWWAAAMCIFFVGEKPPPQPQPQPQEGWGLFIGIGDYTVNRITIDGEIRIFEDLRMPPGDAQAMAAALRSSFPRQKVITDGEATYSAIGEAITEWLSRAPADATVLIYFSGHGDQARDQDGDEEDRFDETWVTADGKVILDDELHRWINALPARKVVLISDSCHSGTIHRGIWAARGRSFFVPSRRGPRPLLTDGLGDDFMGGLRGFGKVIALSACRPHETAWESGHFGHGIFTYCLLKGLEGGADEDGDGWVTAQELFAYTQDCVPHCAQQITLVDGSHPAQHPELHDGIGRPVPLVRVR